MEKDKNLIFQKVSIVISTFLGLGFFPFFSGTFTSLVIVILYAIIPGIEKPLLLFIVTFFVIIFGLLTSGVTEKKYGFDPPQVVIDEVSGMLISLMFVPKTFVLMAIAFLLFRFFDIVKPFPAKMVQEIKGSLGIMLDDIIAGIYTLTLMHFILLVYPEVIYL